MTLVPERPAWVFLFAGELQGMSDTFTITYHFAFSETETKTVSVDLDKGTLELIRRAPARTAAPGWTELSGNQCSNCPLTPSTHPHCPIALNLVDIVESFKDYFSYQDVDVTVTTEERAYFKSTSLQMGLSSLIGIIMVTSGCRPMERLKPMVRFHLPFATLEETIFRTTSMHLVAQYLRQQHGKPADFSLTGLQAIYADVATVNTCFANRLRQAAKKDANINALVNLHCFAEMVPMNADIMLEDIENYFAALLD